MLTNGVVFFCIIGFITCFSIFYIFGFWGGAVIYLISFLFLLLIYNNENIHNEDIIIPKYNGDSDG